jgi:hypothetical protein
MIDFGEKKKNSPFYPKPATTCGLTLPNIHQNQAVAAKTGLDSDRFD